MAQDFGPHLKELRTKKGLSREAVRDRLRDQFRNDAISVSTLEKWESGKTRGMSAASLAQLVAVLDADYEDVFKRLIIIPTDPEGKP